MSLSPSGDTRRSGVVVAMGLAVVAVTYGLGRFTFGLMVPDMAPALGMGDAAVGFAGAGSYAGYFGALLVAPWLVGRLDPRSVASLASVATAAGMLIIAVAPGPALLAVGVTLAGTGSGLASPALAELVERLLRRRRRAPAQAWVNAGTSVGIVAGVVVAVAAAGQWRAAWAALAGLALVVALAPSRVDPPEAGASSSGFRGSIGLVVAAVSLGIASSAMWAFGREAVLRAGAFSSTGSMAVWAAIGIGGLGGGLVGRISDRYGLAVAGRLGWIVMAAALGLMALAPGSRLAMALAAVAFGAAYMALTGVLLLWGVRVGAERPSSGVRTAFLALAVGQLSATPVVGIVAEAWGLAVAFALAAGAALAGSATSPDPGPSRVQLGPGVSGGNPARC